MTRLRRTSLDANTVHPKQQRHKQERPLLGTMEADGMLSPRPAKRSRSALEEEEGRNRTAAPANAGDAGRLHASNLAMRH
jgi:hypothetical protein